MARRVPAPARALVRLGAGVLVLALVLHGVGAAPFLAGLDALGPGLAVAAIVITGGTTACCALRWRRVVRGFGADLGLRHALAAYYRSQFLDAILPGGVLGDVYRALRRGSRIGALAHGVRSVFWERVLGQLAQLAGAALVLASVASPLRGAVRALLAALGLAALAAFAARRPLGRWLRSAGPRALVATLDTMRGWTRAAWASIAATSLLALAGYLLIFVLAARAVGVDWPTAQLAAVLLVALVASAVPFNVAGFGPREGVAAWMFAASGGDAAQGVAAATLYGVLGLVSVAPGAIPLAVDWLLPAGRR